MVTDKIRADMRLATVSLDLGQFLGLEWRLVSEDHDGRNAELTEIDFSKVAFVSSLSDSEKRIKGEDVLKRLKAGNRIPCGVTVFKCLWNDYLDQRQKDKSGLMAN